MPPLLECQIEDHGDRDRGPFSFPACSNALLANALSTFNYLSNDIRVVQIDSQPWFVAADVCRTLGLDLTYGTSNHLKKLDADEKRPVPLNTIPGKGMAQAALISEPGLYKLIGRSVRHEARAFDRWVRHEVLPAIRKDGLYVAGEERLKTGEMSDDELTLTAVASL